jgi:AcrR family transcriptional regulator
MGYHPLMGTELPGDRELPLRARKKLQSRRRIQTVAIDRLDERAYEDVTIEEIARQAEVSPSTVYRHFSTKEGIFLWDEYDEAVFAEFRHLISGHRPIESMMEAVDHVMSERFDRDRERVFRQLELIGGIAPLRQSAAARLDELRKELAATVADAGWPQLEAAVVAGSLVTALQGAIEVWVSGQGREPLPELFRRALEMLAEGLDRLR